MYALQILKASGWVIHYIRDDATILHKWSQDRKYSGKTVRVTEITEEEREQFIRSINP